MWAGAAICAAVAVFLWMPVHRARVRDRLTRLLPDLSAPGRASQAPRRSRNDLVRYVAAALAGLAGAGLIGGALGLASGVVIAVGCARVLSRLEPREARARRARIAADLPVAIDLLAACLRGGAPWSGAVDAVAEALGGPVGEALGRVSAQVRLGADPASAWLTLVSVDPGLAALGRVAARTATSGAPLAPTLARLAEDQRRKARAAAAARARAAGVRAVAPLGLCFLPAFILLGIVPAIAGIAANVLLP